MGSWSGARVLVAGGAGFIGSHLCERLVDSGAQVTCLDSMLTGSRANLARIEGRGGFRIVEADIVQPLPRALSRRRYTHVCNLACVASPPLYQRDPEHTLMTSVLGTARLLRLAERCGARLLISSTSEVYGDPHVSPQPETYLGNVNCTGPRACYDEGKRCAETLAFDYDRVGRVEVRVARIFNTYGPRLPAGDGRVVSNFIAQALRGDDLTVYGDGRQTRSFCFVDDTVDALLRLLALDGAQPGPVNIGNPNEMTINELMAEVLRLIGSSSAVAHRPLPQDDPRRRRPDIAKAAALLDWRPVTPLGQGLRATIDWFETEGAPVLRDRTRRRAEADA
ncbi:MAG TPA: NAD-dependent epimerase/dehydratase family protein [Caulobacteraceae bacterium]|nr:NAD-dependent epimerase/dehydratase family protein [Caulobacteraceae bacterium]